jgi:FMN-dependent NADH-azoreductase
MSSVLFITSSLSGDASTSRLFGLELIDALRQDTPDARVVTRELTESSIPHLSMETLQALAQQPEQRTADQAARAAFADGLIEEVDAADVIVIAAPMYNFSLPSTLKAWIDHIARAGRTFRYTPNGPQGLLKDKKVFVALAQGGKHTGSPMDFVQPYLRGVLAFLGITDVSFVTAEGLAIDAENKAAGIAAARQQIATLFPAAQLAA